MLKNKNTKNIGLKQSIIDHNNCPLITHCWTLLGTLFRCCGSHIIFTIHTNIYTIFFLKSVHSWEMIEKYLGML
jgi:hypothetical protein